MVVRGLLQAVPTGVRMPVHGGRRLHEQAQDSAASRSTLAMRVRGGSWTSNTVSSAATTTEYNAGQKDACRQGTGDGDGVVLDASGLKVGSRSSAAYSF